MGKLREAVVIRKCDNLNKENFWDTVMEHCPVTMNKFCEWIDNYKKSQIVQVVRGTHGFDWDALFGNKYQGGYKIKFHDLPLEMQVGIVFKFFADHGLHQLGNRSGDWFQPDTWIDIICSDFEWLELNSSF